MHLSPQNAALLQTYGQLAVAFAGFAGVIGAFSRFRMHAEATAFRVRSMVTMAVGEVIFSLLPAQIASFGVSESATWRVSAGALAIASTILLLVFGRQAHILYQQGRLMKTAAYILCLMAVILITPLYAAALGIAGEYAAPIYFTQLFFGMVVCAYHFVMLIIAVRLDDGE